MVDNAPMYSLGDIVSPLAQSLIMTYQCTNVNITKGDVVALTATPLTDGSAPGTVASTSTLSDATAIGIATDSYTTTDATSPRVVPVMMHGITKVTLTAVAVTQGLALGASGTLSLMAAVAAPTTAPLLAGVVGWAITNFGSGDSGYIFVVK